MAGRESGDTRRRLTDAATELSHRVGLANVSLATIGEHAGVPVGNIYYHFKTKEELAATVVEARRAEYEDLRRSWEDRGSGPADHLLAFVGHTRDSADLLAAHGCPVGGLCRDLRRAGSPSGDEAAGIFADTIAWAARQYAGLGHPTPDAAGAHLVALLQGATVLAHGLGDPSLLHAECDRAAAEIRGLPEL